MIAFITGTIIERTKDTVVIKTNGGVGYAVRVGLHVGGTKGQLIELYTYLKVSEQAMDLYGFQTIEERAFFDLLLSVSGVGPKTAMHILSLGSIEDISGAIAREDAAYLSAVQGIGKKTAERMVVELKSKVKSANWRTKAEGDISVGGVLEEVVDGLMGMGYTAEQAREAVRGLEGGEKTTEELLREALRRK